MRAKLKRWLIWPDTHAPYHDEAAVEALIRDAQAWKPDAICVLGDFWDFYGASTFPKDPERKHRLVDEVRIGAALLKRVAKLAPERIFLEGNHEKRLSKFIAANAPELEGLVPSVRDIVGQDWRFFQYGKVAMLSRHLAASHDFGKAGAGSFVQTLREYGHGAVHGHTHGLGVAYGGTADGARHAVMAAGHLADTEACDYMHVWKARRDWTTGCGAVYVGSNDYFLRPVPFGEAPVSDHAFDELEWGEVRWPVIRSPSPTRSNGSPSPSSPACSAYFPDALLEVAVLSRIGNDQHNPGEPLHWAKEKSTDEYDALTRHLLDVGTRDTDGVRHAAKVAWRALAGLQREIDKERG